MLLIPIFEVYQNQGHPNVKRPAALATTLTTMHIQYMGAIRWSNSSGSC